MSTKKKSLLFIISLQSLAYNKRSPWCMTPNLTRFFFPYFVCTKETYHDSDYTGNVGAVPMVIMSLDVRYQELQCPDSMTVR